MPTADARTDSWHGDGWPELRSGPPWVMEEMIDAEPGLARGVAESAPAAAAIASMARDARARSLPVVVTGCGTSEHAAQAIAALLSGTLGPGAVEPRQALDAATEPCPGLCIGVSHEGETAATLAALAAARHSGAATALVTAAPSSRGAAAADAVLATPLVDRSWCHTVGYVSPLLAGGLIAAALEQRSFDAPAVERLLADLGRLRVDASALTGAARLVTAGAGLDSVTARELALKVAEGARLPTSALSLENVLHGHLVGHDGSSALVVISTERADSLAVRRTAPVLAAASRIGLVTGAVVTRETAAELEADVVVAVDLPVDVQPGLGRLLAGALALQRLTLAFVHARGVNPDLLRRDEPAYREAAALGEKRTATVFDTRTRSR